MTKIKITQFINSSKAGQFTEQIIDAPELKPHDILVEVSVCGVCHTDCLFLGAEGCNLGHEPVGKVVEKGSKVDKFEIGDIVGVSYLKWACMECRSCISGHDTMCEKRILFPEGNLNGFASHLLGDSR
jgi:D-arabinose 1-dehydrogenase-like Zn-dependent alcohol dehydrogenase